jgi:hypothetical protein
MSKHQLSTLAFLVAAAVAVIGGGQASAHDYTTFDHPSLPCNLSEEAVANWGETSAHLPQACTYG